MVVVDGKTRVPVLVEDEDNESEVAVESVEVEEDAGRFEDG